MSYTEANYENAVIEIFRDTLGYRYVYAPDVARDCLQRFSRDVRPRDEQSRNNYRQ